MLIIFVALAILATKFYFASFGMLPTADHFEYIIVGAGPAGSLLVRHITRGSPCNLFRQDVYQIVVVQFSYLKLVVQPNTNLEVDHKFFLTFSLFARLRLFRWTYHPI